MAADDAAPAKRVTIITVHGTGDKDPAETGEKKWWEPGSSFCRNLSRELASQRIDAEFSAFKWSGENSVIDREKAAEALRREIKRRAKTQEVHVIGHSHGGNVAHDAAIFLRWGRNRRRKSIASLSTVGTPYLRSPVSAFQRFGAYFFLIIAVFGAAVLGVACLVSIAGDLAAFIDGAAPRIETAFVALALLVGETASVLMIREALQGVRRVSKPGLLRSDEAEIFSLWHPRDEAIALLNAAETVEITPFAPGSMFRGSRIGGVLTAVRITIVLVILAALYLVAHAAGAGDVIERGLSYMRLGWLGAWLNSESGLGLRIGDGRTYLVAAAILLAILAVAWMVFYGAYRLVFGAAAELLLRERINRAVRNIFRGMAFGSVGDQRPAAVDTESAIFRSVSHRIEGQLADAIETKAQRATIALLEKYRTEIFNVGANHLELFKKIPRDVMTWDSLIHTTYFDHPEIATLIAGRIAAAHSSAPA